MVRMPENGNDPTSRCSRRRTAAPLTADVGHGEYEEMKRFLTRILLVAVLVGCLFGVWYFTLSPRAHVTRALRAIAEAEAAIGEAPLDPFKMKAPVRQYCTAL